MLLIKHHSYYRRCKTKYHWRSVDALLTLIFRLWLGAWVSVFCTSRQLIRRTWTVTYQCEYFTISSSISECSDICETRNAEPEIGSDGSSQTRRNRRVDGYWTGFDPSRVSRLGFWPGLEPNRPIFEVRTRTAGGSPEPVANTSSSFSVSTHHQEEQKLHHYNEIHTNVLMFPLSLGFVEPILPSVKANLCKLT